MRQSEIKVLQAALELKQRELNLVMAIDHIRDTAPDPATMLATIVNTLLDLIRVDLCLIALIDQETGQIESKSMSDRSDYNLGYFLTTEMAERAAALEQIMVWDREMAGLAETNLPPNLQIAAVPIIINANDRLGSLLLARTHPPFISADIKLLETAESMVDSAVIQGYADHELKQRVKELEAIYRIDNIRDLGLPFDEMLNIVLLEVCQVIDAEMGFTMLYDNTGHQLELRAATHKDLFQIASYYQLINQLANEAINTTKLLCRNELDDGLHSLMCLPLILNEQIIGVLGVANRRDSDHFTIDDQRLLSAIGSQIDTAIFENIEKRRLRQVLGRSVDPRIMERLLANTSVDFLKGERAVLTVLYADLRGSTQLTENTDPEMLLGFINHYLGQMTDVILEHEGTLDKFVGDEVMALFGAPFPQEDHALNAVRVGLAMQKAHQTLMDIWQDRGLPAPPIGVGIATGELIVGEMGCPQRADYTVLGRAANLGARICSAAKGGEVLISQRTYNLIAADVDAVPIPDLQFKGFNLPVTVYHINKILG